MTATDADDDAATWAETVDITELSALAACWAPDGVETGAAGELMVTCLPTIACHILSKFEDMTEWI